MSIEYLLSYVVRGTSSEDLQKLLEMTASNLKTERRTLQDILANVFCLHQKPHRKNDIVWANENLRNICKPNDKYDVRIFVVIINGMVTSLSLLMKCRIFVAITNGMVPIVHAFLDGDGHLSSVNGFWYLILLQDIIWPSLHYPATRSLLWWVQDSAPPPAQRPF